ncbi:ribbon-helix-helix domain-containing protein [Collimonas sp.]|jgi:predicted DNA-binding ribbon-helix-helix protein|uniref:ribbon-helix-helix domain-containing protein n=1 Tax=Collimonas sp. TaxID=1963772 RepID=UPI002C1ADFF9|nr:ribbon-helix-helix domain-containing protein [Collimonas sp.]HWX03492.1 ribbon-helix-helix domain-containing protein [Collimonas sp.]
MCQIYAQADPILYESRARSVRIMGVITTIKLENLFWQTLAELAADNDLTTNQLIAKLHDEVTTHLGEASNFSSFLRVTCLRYQSLKTHAGFATTAATAATKVSASA